MTTLFISDLHLSAERPVIVALFQKFLKERAINADALYILGDLFEVWLGDDYCEPGIEPVLQALKDFSDSGKPLFVLHGNRDFLMGHDFEKHTGSKILADPSIINVANQQALITHGDTLCTDDTAYMAFRNMVRNPDWQSDFLSRPIEERITFARQARSESISQTQQKPMDIMDVNQNAVEQVMSEHRIELLIHGHTHRPATHQFTYKGKSLTRIVLGDWYAQGSVLACDDIACTMENINP